MTSGAEEDRPFTVLISSAGRRVSLMRSFREAFESLGVRGRVIAADLTDMTAAMQLADGKRIVPRCTDPSFTEFLTDLCVSDRVDLVVPTIDTELPVWAAMAESLAAKGTVVAVSSPEAIAIAADKRLTNAHCREQGIPVPRQTTPAAVSDNRADWTMPLVVKPAAGSSGIGLHIVNTWAEFDGVLARGADQTLIVEEFLPGIEHTVDVFVNRAGRASHPVVRRRLEVRSGEVSKALVVRDEFLASLAVRTVESLPGAYGVFNVQIFSNGMTAGVIEINARFGGGYPLTWRAGGRYSEWLVRDVKTGEATGHEADIDYGLTMLRWDEEVFTRG